MEVSLESNKSGLIRALALLDHIRMKSPESLGVTTISRDTNTPKAVVYRILKDFTVAGYLYFDDETKLYSLGQGVLELGLTALRTLDIPVLARPHLEQLVHLTQETATLSIRQGWSRVYLDQVESSREMRMAVALGSRHPLHSGSSSKAILSGMHDDELAEFFRMATSMSLANGGELELQKLESDITAARRRGYALSSGERQVGAGSVAAPLYSVTGAVWGSISLCGPRERFDADACVEYGTLVAASAREISGGLTQAVSRASKGLKQ